MIRYLVVDDNDAVYGDFSCDGLAYELIDLLSNNYPKKNFRIIERKK